MKRDKKLLLPAALIFVVWSVLGLDQVACGGTIQGTVRDFVSGNPVSGVYVEAFEVNFGYVSTGGPGNNLTAPDGTYSLTVLNGIYKVFFRRSDASITYTGQWRNAASSYAGAAEVAVPQGTTATGIDAYMKVASAGFVSGQVTGPNGAGIPNAEVWIYDYDQPVQSKRGLVSALTNVLGFYNITAPLPPGKYKVECREFASNLLPEWWNDKTSFSQADPLVIGVSGLNQANCQLKEGGIISGKVTDGSNNPLQSALVTIYDLNQKMVTITSTGADGLYSAKRLRSGAYQVKFAGPSNSNLAFQWYNQQPTFELAQEVPVTEGSTTPGINAQLSPGGTITGTTGLAGVQVKVYDLLKTLISSVTTARDGSFAVPGLPTGAYKLEFDHFSLGSVWHNGGRTFDRADEIAVTAGNTTPGINGALLPAAKITGRVTDTQGKAIPKVMVRVFDDATLTAMINTGQTNSFGDYVLDNLSAGSTRVFFDGFGTGYFSEWWNDKISLAEAVPLQLISGATSANVDAQLVPGRGLYFPLILKN